MKVISGGQTGADQGGLMAARDLGVETGGWAPKGWRTEIGAAPQLREWGLRESSAHSYYRRTMDNVRDSDGTVIFGKRSPGSLTTYKFAGELSKPVRWFSKEEIGEEEWNVHARRYALVQLYKWVGDNGITCVNVAGNRESVSPGIQESVRGFMRELLKRYVGGDR